MSVNLSNEADTTQLPDELKDLCKQLNLSAEGVISKAIVLLNHTITLEQKGYCLQARKKGLLGLLGEVIHLNILRR